MLGILNRTKKVLVCIRTSNILGWTRTRSCDALRVSATASGKQCFKLERMFPVITKIVSIAHR